MADLKKIQGFFSPNPKELARQVQELERAVQDSLEDIDPAEVGEVTAADVSFDSSASSLTSDNVQDALIEVYNSIPSAAGTPYFFAYYTPEVGGAQFNQYTWTTSTEEGGMTSSSNHTVTVPEDGLYRVEVCIRATNASTSNPLTITSDVRTSSGGTVAIIRENRQTSASSLAVMGAVAITLRLSSGDTVWVRRSNGSTTSSGAGSTSSFLCVTKEAD